MNDPLVTQITERERQVLALLRDGLPNRTIGSRLGIAENTVKVHMSHLFRKINVTNRVAAAGWAHAHPAEIPPLAA